MFLAIREFRHAWSRYLLLGAIVALIAWLVFLLSGLANGLARDNAGAIQGLPAERLLLQSGARLQLGRSLLPSTMLDQVRREAGTEAAAPIGQMMLSVKPEAGGVQLDAAMLAIEPQSFLAPPLVAGSGLVGAPTNGVVIDRKLADKGIALGDTLIVQPSGERLVVVGLTSGQTYGHAPVIFATLEEWRALRFAARGAAGAIPEPISAIALRADAATAARLHAALADTELATRGEVVRQLPGYSEESGTLLMIQVFLFVIAALILAVFFYIVTLQKTAQFGLLKAVGARTSFLARDLIVQMFALDLGGIAVGAALTLGVAALVPPAIPFALDPRLVVLYGAVLLLTALVGIAISLRRIATVDPLIAIGRND